MFKNNWAIIRTEPTQNLYDYIVSCGFQPQAKVEPNIYFAIRERYQSSSLQYVESKAMSWVCSFSYDRDPPPGNYTFFSLEEALKYLSRYKDPGRYFYFPSDRVKKLERRARKLTGARSQKTFRKANRLKRKELCSRAFAAE